MSNVIPGFLTAHRRYLARVELASGEPATLYIEDVQFLYPPHQVQFPVLRQRNPVVQHFFVAREHERLEIAYHPGLATRAGRTAWRSFSDGAAALRSLTEWAQGRSRAKGYYVVEDDWLSDEPVILHPVHFNDLEPLGS